MEQEGLLPEKAKLSPEEKLKIIRLNKNIRQIDLAVGIGCSDALISRAENPNLQDSYKREHIVAIKKYMDIDYAPIFDDELIFFRQRIYVLMGLIRDGHLEEAKKILGELSVITELPFEKDLIFLYEMMEIRFLLANRKFDEVSEKLRITNERFEGLSVESLYYFYYNAGTSNLFKGNSEKALELYSVAYNMEIDDQAKEPTLYFNFAICHAWLGNYLLSLTLLEKMYHLFENIPPTHLAVNIENNLGLNYLKLGHIEQAREHFDKAFAKANTIQNNLFVGYALHNHGYASYLSGEHRDAIKYLEQAEEYFKKGDGNYLENLYRKIRCQIAMGATITKDVMPDALVLAEGNEYYTLLFNTLNRMVVSPKDDDTLNFIEENTIPHLLGKYRYDDVLDYYRFLKTTYSKRLEAKTLGVRQRDTLERKVINIELLTFDIYKNMIKGREKSEEKNFINCFCSDDSV